MKTNTLAKTVALSTSLLVALAGFVAGCSRQSPEPTIAAPGSSPSSADATTSCAAQGWAAHGSGTNGGGTATVTVATTYDQLKAAITNPAVKVVQVSGTITIPSGGRISWQDQSSKTLFGTAGARLVSTDQSQSNSGIMYVKRCSNLVIRNLIFDGPGPTTPTGPTT